MRHRQQRRLGVSASPATAYLPGHDRHARARFRRSPADRGGSRPSPDPGRPRRTAVPGRRLGLSVPRLSRPAAADPQERRPAGRRRPGLLQHVVEADARHAGRRAHPPGGDLGPLREDVPQHALRQVQGPPAAAARGPDPAVPAGARGHPRVRRAGHRAARLRGRRPDRRLCLPRARAGRRDGDRLVRQGPDAAGRRRRVDVRPDEGRAHRPRAGVREVRRLSRAGGRRAVAVRRQRRQRAGRSRHRHQDRRPADQRIWRPGHPAGPGRRDQAAQAPRDPDRVRRPDPPVAPWSSWTATRRCPSRSTTWWCASRTSRCWPTSWS
jgi:hypothetical protein